MYIYLSIYLSICNDQLTELFAQMHECFLYVWVATNIWLWIHMESPSHAHKYKETHTHILTR